MPAQRRYYRADPSSRLPAQVGTVIDGGEHGAVTKKQQKLSFLGEMMSDDKVKRRAKSQFLKATRAQPLRTPHCRHHPQCILRLTRTVPFHHTRRASSDCSQVQAASMEGVKKSKKGVVKKKNALGRR
jgi:hypothetical protein